MPLLRCKTNLWKSSGNKFVMQFLRLRKRNSALWLWTRRLTHLARNRPQFQAATSAKRGKRGVYFLRIPWQSWASIWNEELNFEAISKKRNSWQWVAADSVVNSINKSTNHVMPFVLLCVGGTVVNRFGLRTTLKISPPERKFLLRAWLFSCFYHVNHHNISIHCYYWTDKFSFHKSRFA